MEENPYGGKVMELRFKDIALKNNQPTEPGMRAIKLLREYFFCKICPFKDEPNKNKACINCEHANLSLLTTLDAWRPLGIGNIGFGLALKLCHIPEPWDIAEHLLRTLEDTCPDCEGKGWYNAYKKVEPMNGVYASSCTCNDGMRTLYELWEREVV